MTDDVWVTTEIPLDNETRTALLLFNERLDARALAQRGKKRVAKAERVRKVNDNPDATAEQKAEAEAAYKAAADEYNVIAANPTAGLDKPKAKKKEEPAAEDAPAEAEAPSAAVVGEDSLQEVSADEEDAPAAEAADADAE